MYHATNEGNLLRLFQQGIQPGCRAKTSSRKEVHFGPLTPRDKRNALVKRPLATSVGHMALIPTKPLLEVASSLPVLLATNGCLLTTETLKVPLLAWRCREQQQGVGEFLSRRAFAQRV